MSKLQITAEKSENLTLNVDLSQSMIPLNREQLLSEVCLLTPIEYILTASKYWILEIGLFTTKSKKWVLTEEGKPGGTFLTFFACKGSAYGKQYISLAFILKKVRLQVNRKEFFLLVPCLPVRRNKQGPIRMGASFFLTGSWAKQFS